MVQSTLPIKHRGQRLAITFSIFSLVIGLTACGSQPEGGAPDVTDPNAPSEQTAPSTTSNNNQPPNPPTPGSQSSQSQTESQTEANKNRADDKHSAAVNPEPPTNGAQRPLANQSANQPTSEPPPQALSTEEFCAQAITQLALNDCSQRQYDAADATLNAVYQELTQQLAPEAETALITAESAWIEFRDLDCGFVSNQYAGGSIVPLIRNSCLTTRTETRTEELQQQGSPQIDYANADAQLNNHYQDLLSILTSEDTKAMQTVQLAWIEYRDRNCTFEASYGNTGETQCLARMSQTRTGEFQNMIEQRSSL